MAARLMLDSEEVIVVGLHGLPPSHDDKRLNDDFFAQAFLLKSEKHPKKSNTKIFFCPPPRPPSKFFAFAFSYIQRKHSPNTKNFGG